jgi:hypothetical protein
MVPRWIEGAAITTSELAENGPALLRTFTIDLMDSTVPLHFQFPPMRAFFLYVSTFVMMVTTGVRYRYEAVIIP